MVNLIGDVPAREAPLDVEGAHLHLYGKTGRPGRKVGHVTVVCADAGATGAAVDRLRAVLP
jgi:5-(carboxyamino)imidazole ribonucleotide synthase